MAKATKSKVKKSPMTLDKLAVMVARGFEETHEKIDRLGVQVVSLEDRITKLEQTVNDMANKLAHYIDLHEERYLDLKHRYKLIAQWAEKVAAKTGVPFQLDDLF